MPAGMPDMGGRLRCEGAGGCLSPDAIAVTGECWSEGPACRAFRVRDRGKPATGLRSITLREARREASLSTWLPRPLCARRGGAWMPRFPGTSSAAVPGPGRRCPVRAGPAASGAAAEHPRHPPGSTPSACTSASARSATIGTSMSSASSQVKTASPTTAAARRAHSGRGRGGRGSPDARGRRTARSAGRSART